MPVLGHAGDTVLHLMPHTTCRVFASLEIANTEQSNQFLRDANMCPQELGSYSALSNRLNISIPAGVEPRCRLSQTIGFIGEQSAGASHFF